jgi:pyridinium-3,5-bisthiocarboxylic acid mononucleotide nickel chelatase
MRTLYLDLLSGISGDMFLGALIDVGLDFKQLQEELRKLPLQGYHLHCGRGRKALIDGVKIDVHVHADHEREHLHDDSTHHRHNHAHHGESHGHPEHEHHHHRHEHEPDAPAQHSHVDDPVHDREHGAGETRDFKQIRNLIQGSGLSVWVKDRAVAVFHRIAVAEGKVHGLPPDQVHFHEVGAVDSIVDIVGACIGLEQLGKPRVLASAVTEGIGWVQCAHGRFPLPAPATLAILGERGVPLTQCDEPNELVTPTGAALLAEFVESFGPMRSLVARRIGHGLGSRDNVTRPNVLRAILGESESALEAVKDWERDVIGVLETNLDDVRAEVLGHFVKRALDAGALDVFQTPIQMKKNRPGVLLTVLCEATAMDRFAELMLRETTAFGVRMHLADRRKLRRETARVNTPFGEVTLKLGRLDGRVVQTAPEYESCRAVSERAGVALKDVYDAALRAAPNA